MSYRPYQDYDDDRDVITCVTLSDTRPEARKEHTCGGCKKTTDGFQRTGLDVAPDGRSIGLREGRASRVGRQVDCVPTSRPLRVQTAWSRAK